jgi:CRISPR/Cas system endoribonuclease Cas6 (RAMP superfamily)
MNYTDRGRITYYFRPTDEGFSEAVRRSFVGKYKTTYGKLPGDYVERHLGPEHLLKIIRLQEGGPDKIHVKSVEVLFTLKETKDLMKTVREYGIELEKR